MKFSKMKGN